ncbi:MAG: DNA mismatch repair protein MutS [Rhodospirillales bacterium]|nr:DNA mismatch repair protein MutS [Rhodospirillales bacterium]
MMAQYLAVKREHPDGLLFYRMGDFYELFFDDAAAAAAALDITLTKRGKHLGRDIPMCGVPVHSHEVYLSRLIRKGFKVAVCEQTENPAEARKRGSKTVVRREVVRFITPGTLTEDTLLEARRNNFLAAIAEAQGDLGLAWIDVSTGDFFMQATTAAAADAAFARLAPGEVLVPEPLLARPSMAGVRDAFGDRLSPLPASRFDSDNGRKRLESLFAVDTLDGFGAFSRAELAAGGALIDYVDLTQKGRLPRIAAPKRLGPDSVMEIDAATRRNLELTETFAGERRGSLLDVVDRTLSGAGGRLLASHIAAPLRDLGAIERRLDMVQFFVDDVAARDPLRGLLRGAADVERALSRLSVGRGGPRELAAIRDGLGIAAEIGRVLGRDGLTPPPAGVAQALAALGGHAELIEKLRLALAPELPPSTKDGGFIARGFAPPLDELRTLRDEGRRLVAGLERRYADEIGISTLKIRHNNVLGYFVEVPARQAERMPGGAESDFRHRQTLASAVRYSTVELAELESRIARAGEQSVVLEIELFETLARAVMTGAESVARTASAMAALDVAAALAELAADRDYSRPILDDGFGFEVTAGRHPVVEAALAADGRGAFVANDCGLTDGGAEDGPDAGSRLWLLTGPNMAGKSTFLRQNALLAVMAQMGSFIPAGAARIGVVDRLFSRVGAADDLARGRSTFMVEMVETAAILNQAGPRSLVILDEIGRGTATFDGLSIAWAVVEHLHEVNRSRVLFATHYHELTSLSSRLAALACHTMRVKEWQGEVIFLHEVAPGAADRSYGIHVARLAGLPSAVTARAESVLATLEAGEQSSALTRLADDLPLFAAAGVEEREAQPSLVEEMLESLNADALTPRQALELIYRLKAALAGEEC